MRRRYAETTSVSVGRSRQELDDLLRRWGCAAISWSDNFEQGWAQLSFAWKRDADVYLAKFRIKITATGHTKRDQERIGRQEHRVLCLWIKAALNAVDSGIIPAEAIFLPFLVGKDGQTVADVALPRLPSLLKGGADHLLLGSGA